MIRLAAACRKTSVRRTTGRPRSDDVRENLSGADRGQLVDVADDEQRRVIWNGFQQRLHQQDVDHRRFVDDEEVAVEAIVVVAFEASVLGSTSSSR